MENLIDSEPDAEVKLEAIKTYCKIGDRDWSLDNYFEHPDPEIRQAAITGLLGNKDNTLKETAEKTIGDLIHSSNHNDKKIAISILTQVKDEYDHPEHAQLINDTDLSVKEAAIKAVGKSAFKEYACCFINGDIPF